eukprot:821023-Rhodomonas_salina.1
MLQDNNPDLPCITEQETNGREGGLVEGGGAAGGRARKPSQTSDSDSQHMDTDYECKTEDDDNLERDDARARVREERQQDIGKLRGGSLIYRA